MSIFFWRLGRIKGFKEVSKFLLGSFEFKELKSFWKFNSVEGFKLEAVLFSLLTLLLKIFSIFEKSGVFTSLLETFLLMLLIKSWMLKFKLFSSFLFSVKLIFWLELLFVISILFLFSSVTGVLVSWWLRRLWRIIYA